MCKRVWNVLLILRNSISYEIDYSTSIIAVKLLRNFHKFSLWLFRPANLDLEIDIISASLNFDAMEAQTIAVSL